METELLDPPAAAPDATPAPPAATPDAPAKPATLLDGVVDPAAAPTPQAPLIPPAKSKYVTDDGAFAENWRDNLKDPALRADGTLALYKNIDDMAKALVEKQKMIGKRQEREAMPAPDAPAEKWAEWRKLTGAPDAPTGYGELRPDNVPKEQWDAELEGGLRAIAHKYGAPPALVKELAEAYTGRQFALSQAQVAMEAQRLEKGQAELREAFGPDYSRQMAYAAQGAAALGFDVNDPEQRAFFLSPKALQNFARAFQHNFLGDRAEGMKDGANGFGGGIDDRAAEIRKSPAYQGKEGPIRQAEAQKAYHQCLAAKDAANNQMIRRKAS